MRLKSVFISSYKNLKDFSISFDSDSFIEVFVGKNGAGKSNFFEALIEIFRHLYVKQRPILTTFSICFSGLYRQITIKKQCNNNYTRSILDAVYWQI